MKEIRIWPECWDADLDIDKYFETTRPLEVDVGCGKGRFLLSRAGRYPGINFLGIDRMLRRVRKVANKARARQLDNLRLLRIDAKYAVGFMLPPSFVSAYYVFFPDPWPKKRHRAKRFFDDEFFSAVIRTLKPAGCIHVATDHEQYFREIVSMLERSQCFVREETFMPMQEERTEFERYYIKHKHVGRCSFRKLHCSDTVSG